MRRYRTGPDTLDMKTRLIVAAVVAFVAVVGGCIGLVRVRNDRVTLGEDEFRGRVADSLRTGSSTEADVVSFLDALKAEDRDDKAVIEHYPAEVVLQEECSPRPCSLVDQGIAPGVIEITARVWNSGVWTPDFCTNAYIAFFVFDDSHRYSRLILKDGGFCL